ncbi:MAG: hypothetical protein Q7S52_04305 [bacterium]|nr:hypothetical protein [bacterium]
MNRFVQFLVALCSFVWLVIGVGVLAGGIVLVTFIVKEKPFEQLQQLAPLLQMSSGVKGNTNSSNQSIEQLIANPEFQACAIRVLGESRVATLLRQQQLPSSSEMIRLSACISKQ